VERAQGFPELRQVVLDCTNARELAEFYRQLLGYAYRPGDEPFESASPDEPDADWLVLRDPAGRAQVAFQQVDDLPESTWPDDTIPKQLHLDLMVPTIEDLNAQHDKVLSLGGKMLYDRSAHPEEPLRVYADLAGHPFCIFVLPR
jgi:hypothetical protein